jgi:hypothetical protein
MHIAGATYSRIDDMDPELREMVNELGYSEDEARWILSIDRGLISGDCSPTNHLGLPLTITTAPYFVTRSDLVTTSNLKRSYGSKDAKITNRSQTPVYKLTYL